MRNEQLLPASAFVVLTTGVIASVEKTDALPNAEFWIGIAIAYMFIALIAQVNPDIGSGIAILILVSALLANGEAIAGYVNKRTRGKIGTGTTDDKSARQPGRVPARLPRLTY